MKKTAIGLMILTIFMKCFGFARDVVLAYAYGATSISDAYLIALTIPGVAFSIVATSLATTFVPIYSRLESESKDRANKFASRLVVVVLGLCLTLILLAEIFTEPLVKVFASGFTGETLDLAVSFTRITVIGIIFTALTNIFVGYLHVNSKFNVPASMGLPYNIVIIAFTFLSLWMKNPVVMVWGLLLGMASQFVYVGMFAKRLGFKFGVGKTFKDHEIKVLLLLAIPVIMGSGVNQINALIDKTLASQIAEGAISALTYASRLNGFVQGIFASAIAVVIYPLITKMVLAKDKKGIVDSLSESVISTSVIILPITVGAMIFARQAVELLFGRGSFNEEAVNLTTNALFFYAIGMTAFGLRDVLNRYFFAYQDTKTPIVNAAIGVAINIVLNLMLYKVMGVGGLALATSISAIVTTMLQFVSLRKKIGPFGMLGIIKSFGKMCFASIIMGIVAKLGYNMVVAVVGQNLAFVVAIGVGAICYFAIIYFMKIEEVDILVQGVKAKLKR